MTRATGAPSRGAWLVVIDMQQVFSAGTPWAAPDYATAESAVERLLPAFEERVVFTRYVAPAEPQGAWVAYFEQWPFALVPEDHPMYALTLDPRPHQVVTRTTFGKWGPELAAATGGAPELVVAGVSTDCCVLSTALAAADAGVCVRVVADACAAASAEDHRRSLDAMAFYAPLIEITTVADVLAGEHRPSR